MFSSLIFIVLGAFWFAFVFWRKLKEDYLNSQIFAATLAIALFISAFCFIAGKYLAGYLFWGGFAGFMLGIAVSSYRLKLRFYETFEAAVAAVFPPLSGVFLWDGIRRSSLFSLAAFVVTAGFLMIYKFINDKYKNFGWYKSGRIGFAGLTTLGLYFILRGAVALVFPFMLSFSGGYETIVSGVASFFLFLAVFDLSKKT